MKAKQRLELQRAQLVEAFVLLTAVAWCTWLTSSYYASETAVPSPPHASVLVAMLLPRLLQLLNAMAISAIALAVFAPARAAPKAMEKLSRHERDSGLSVGCILPPLVLLSRFLALAFGSSESFVSASTLMYTWIATTASASLLLKIVCFGSCGVLPTLIVDSIYLPVLFAILGVESDQRYVVSTLGRVLIAMIFRFGRLALPRSFTIGEALIVAQIGGIAALDLLLVTLFKVNQSDQNSWLLDIPTRVTSAWHLHTSSFLERAPHQLALQVGVVGGLLICASLAPVLTTYGASSPHDVAAPLPPKGTLWFLLTVATGIIGALYPWSCVLLDTWNPLGWLVGFLLEDATRWQLMAYWFVCLVGCIPAFAFVSRSFGLRQIVARKLFHLLVVVMFVPACFFSAEMLSLSYGVALAVFCLVECVRAVALPPFGHEIATFVKPFIDHREGGRVILTHMYLLLGCALPLWLAPTLTPPSLLVANAGVLALGVGDAMGAVIGSTYGKRKIFGGKTLEGTLAVLVSMVLGSLVFHDFHWQAATHGDLRPMGLLLAGLTLTSLLEAATTQIDNLVLSLYLFAITNLMGCHTSTY